MADKKVGNLTLGVQAQVKGFEGAIGGIAKLGLAISGVQKVAQIATKAIEPLIGAIKGVLDKEREMAQIEAIIKATGGVAGKSAEDIDKLADSLEGLTGIDGDKILGIQKVLLTFVNISGKAFDDATLAVLNMSQTLGSSLQGSAIQVGKALNDVKIGMSAMSKVGISFTQEQKNMAVALQESGDRAGAMKIILDELNKEFGGVAKAIGETMLGRIEKLKLKFEGLKDEIGIALIPVLEEVMQIFERLFETDATGMISNFKILVGSMIATGSELNVMLMKFKLFWNSLRIGFMRLGNAVVQMFANMLDKLLAVFIEIAKIKDQIFGGDLAKNLENSKTQMQAFAEGSTEALKELEKEGIKIALQIDKTREKTDDWLTSYLEGINKIKTAMTKIPIIGDEKTGGEAGAGGGVSESGRALSFRGGSFEGYVPGIKEIVKDTEDWNDKLQLVANSFDVIFDKTKSMQSKMEDILKLIIQFGIGLAAQSNPALAPFAPIIGGIIGGAFSGGGGGTVININNPLLSDQTSYENIANNIRNGLLKSSMNNGGVISV